MREREKERETASIDLFSRQIVYQQKKRERERERNTHLYKIVIAQNLRHTKETPFT